MAEKEQAHRHEREKQELDLLGKRQDILLEKQNVDNIFGIRGQWFGLFIAIGYGVLLAFLAYLKMETAVGIGLGAAAVFGLPRIIGLFIHSKKETKDTQPKDHPVNPVNPVKNFRQD